MVASLLRCLRWLRTCTVIRYGGGCAYDRSGGEGSYGGEVRQSGPVAGKLTMKEASGRDNSPGAELGSCKLVATPKQAGGTCCRLCTS